MKKALFLATPDDFDFRRTINSHGWSDLLPFQLDTESWRLKTVVRLDKPVSVEIRECVGGLEVEFGADLERGAEEHLLASVAHILRFEDDLSGFYATIRNHKSLEWVVEKRAGRLIRSTNVYEDLVKTICTTNCSWSATKSMVTNLVNKLGDETPNGARAFPNAEVMAAQSLDFYRDEIRAGYRAQYLLELATKVANGEIDVESWLTVSDGTPELKKRMKQVKGVGDYAADNLLKLVGRYDGLALDSWLRAGFYKKYRDGVICDDSEIAAHYESFGSWKGLAIWCDMTENWL